MGTELAEQIRDLIDGGARPVSLAEITERASAAVSAPRLGVARSPRLPGRARLVRPLHPRWVAAAAACAVAMASAGVISLAQHPATQAPPGGTRPSAPALVLTAAQVHQMAAASATALAHSGQAVISYRGHGPLPVSQIETVTYSGHDYAFAGRVVGPAFARGGRAKTEAVPFGDRIISGRIYIGSPRAHGLGWIYYQGAVPSVQVPDPRTLLRLLRPTERFRFAGYVTIDGIRLKRLRATDPAAVPGFSGMLSIVPGRRVTAMDVLVDQHNVVRRIGITLREQVLVPETLLGRGNARRGDSGTETTAMTVVFTGIGRPQVIAVPPHTTEHWGSARQAWPAPTLIPDPWPLATAYPAR